MNDVSIRDVVRSPDWFPHAYDADGQTLTLVRLPSEARAELKFLFDDQFGGRFTKASFAGEAVQAALVAERGTTPPAPSHHIFHTSFCGSTLLAKALDIRGVASSLREPAIFTNLANRVTDQSSQGRADRLELVLCLVERSFAPGEVVITKQSSFANRLADEVINARPMSRSVLLYSDLQTYLIALLKRGLKGRIWGRRLFTTLKNWSKLGRELDADDMMELTDMQAASLAWLMQIDQFSDLARTYGPRVMLLDSSQLFTAPAETLHQVSTFFRLGLSERESADIACGPTFAKHSKLTERDYSVDERQREMATISEANAEELAMVIKWIDAFAGHHGIKLRPSV